MCTSAKGFETTSEKVCDTCGLTFPGAFQVLEKKHNGGAYGYDDVDIYHENAKHLFGDTYDGFVFEKYANKNTKMPKRLSDAMGRLKNVPQSKKMPMKVWRNKDYHEIANDYIHELELNKADAKDVHYYIDHSKERKWPYKMEDIIYHLCIIVGKVDLRKCKGYNRNLYDLLMERYHR